jgi:hypothetical protein
MDIFLNSPSGFDIYELAGLAADQGFDGVQLYLNPGLAENPESLEAWRGHLEDRGLALAVHLPPTPDRQVMAALARIARPATPVVSHYPDEPMRPPAGRAAWEFSPFGVRPAEYDEWLRQCRRGHVLPVLDMPRIFKGAGEEQACRFAGELLTRMAGRRYILHLIDCDTAGQARADWCELGQGRVGRCLERLVFPLPETAVLEFESMIQAVNSLPWLRDLSRQLDG